MLLGRCVVEGNKLNEQETMRLRCLEVSVDACQAWLATKRRSFLDGISTFQSCDHITGYLDTVFMVWYRRPILPLRVYKI